MAQESRKYATFQFYGGDPVYMVQVDLEAGTPSREDFNQFLNGIVDLLNNGREFTMFVNASEVGTPPLSASRDVVAFMRQNRPKIAQFMKASAVFIQSETVRKLLSAVFKLQAPVSPNVVVTDMREGVEFLERHM